LAGKGRREDADLESGLRKSKHEILSTKHETNLKHEEENRTGRGIGIFFV
jgi:hypothetical protein